MPAEINVVQYTGLTEEQKEDYVLSANTTTMSKGFVEEKLKLFDKNTLETAGFQSKQIDSLFALEEDTEDDFNADKEAENIKSPKTKQGDIYILGEHRLMCGDSTDKDQVAKLLDGQKADMVFSDPPYNVDYKGRKHGGIMNDNMEEDNFILFCEDFIAAMEANLKQGGVYYLCSGFSSYTPFVYALHKANLTVSGPIVWVKNQATLGWQDYRHKFELVIKAKNTKKKKAEYVLYGWKNGKHYFSGDRDEADVWEFARRAGNTMVHPTQKPIPLVNKAIKMSSKRGEKVLDLFGGSGSTLISAERTNRKAYLMELDSKYCDVIVKRWELVTGQKAKNA